MTGRTARDVVAEMFRRQQAGDDTALDVVAADMINHAAGPQGRDGLAHILRTIDADLGPVTMEQHHLLGEGDLVAQHLTLHGTHRNSTMPLLAGLPVTGRAVTWTFIHIWRVVDGMIVEHWACRDDMSLREQLHRATDDLTVVDTDALKAISEIADRRHQLDSALTDAVRSARRAGRSWSEIGAMLGVSKQAAQRKYSQLAS